MTRAVHPIEVESYRDPALADRPLPPPAAVARGGRAGDPRLRRPRLRRDARARRGRAARAAWTRCARGAPLVVDVAHGRRGRSPPDGARCLLADPARRRAGRARGPHALGGRRSGWPRRGPARARVWVVGNAPDRPGRAARSCRPEPALVDRAARSASSAPPRPRRRWPRAGCRASPTAVRRAARRSPRPPSTRCSTTTDEEPHDRAQPADRRPRHARRRRRRRVPRPGRPRPRAAPGAGRRAPASSSCRDRRSPQAVTELVDAGSRDVVAVPLMLLAAGHAKNDIPATLVRERLSHPGVRIRYGRELGRAAGAAGAGRRAHRRRRRGARARLDRGRCSSGAARRTRTRTPSCSRSRGCYFEGRRAPVRRDRVRLARAAVRVRRAGALPPPRRAERVVVVPYFLFTGVLERRIREQAEQYAARTGLDVRVERLLRPRRRRRRAWCWSATARRSRATSA